MREAVEQCHTHLQLHHLALKRARHHPLAQPLDFFRFLSRPQLQQASALRSVYSWKLLELLMRFKSSGHAEYTIEDFCASMEATEKQSADFAKIRTKIIEPAVKELVEKQGWEIQWRAIKAGRKVQGLRFDFLPAGLSAALLDGATRGCLRIRKKSYARDARCQVWVIDRSSMMSRNLKTGPTLTVLSI